MVTALVVEPMTNPSRNMVHSHIEMPPIQRGFSPYEYFKINQNPSPIWTQVSIVRGRHYCKFIQISAIRSRRKEGKRYTRGDWSRTVSVRENCIKCDITLLSIKMLYLSHTNYDKSLILWLNIKKGWNLYSLTPVKLQPSFWLYNGIYEFLIILWWGNSGFYQLISALIWPESINNPWNLHEICYLLSICRLTTTTSYQSVLPSHLYKLYWNCCWLLSIYVGIRRWVIM